MIYRVSFLNNGVPDTAYTEAGSALEARDNIRKRFRGKKIYIGSVKAIKSFHS